MMQHHLAPVSVFAALMVGFVIDYFSFGPDAWRDKIAWLFYLAGIREGFNGGKLDGWMLDSLGKVVDTVKSAGNTYLASAETNIAVGVIIGGVWIWAFFCMLPEKLTSVKWLSKCAGWKFPKSSSGRVGWKIIGIATVLGLLGDNVHGAVGGIGNWLAELDCQAMGPVLNFLFVDAWG